MMITMAICTRNRADQLRRVLETIAEMRIPEGLQWELLLIDNGSTDDTASVVSAFEGDLPLRYIFEPKPGLSNARNRAVAEASGDYICWTDDDVLIEPGWLAEYASSFAGSPDIVFFGGPVEPVLAVGGPQWIVDHLKNLGGVFAERDFGPDPISLTIEHDRLPFGANYAVRTVDQRRHLYDVNLGVAPGRKRLGEESAVLEALVAEGYRGKWVPGARVQHVIPASRQTLGYVLAFHEAAGETWAYLCYQRGHNLKGKSEEFEWRLFRVPVWVWTEILANGILYFITRKLFKPRVWLKYWLGYGYCRGVVGYCLRHGHK